MQDEVLTVIRRVDENWAEGKLRNKIGIFPISFVDMNTSAKTLMVRPQLETRPLVTSPGWRGEGGPQQALVSLPSSFTGCYIIIMLAMF